MNPRCNEIYRNPALGRIKSIKMLLEPNFVPSVHAQHKLCVHETREALTKGNICYEQNYCLKETGIKLGNKGYS